MLDAMRMSTACFARAHQRYTSRLSKHFLLTFQEVTPLSKTRNQLYGNPNITGRAAGFLALQLSGSPPSLVRGERGGE
jgi:hypothetical protein